MNEVDDSRGARPLSVLVVIDAATYAVTRSYELRAGGKRHHFNHVVVDKHGIAYVSDTLHASIHTVDTTRPADRLRLLVKHGDLELVHGLALSGDGSKLIATSYRGGIKFVDLKTRALMPFSDRGTAGDDGLAYHRGHLYGIGQNRLTRYVLSANEDAIASSEVLVRDHARFNDPRCLAVAGDWLYALANIEHEPVTSSSREQRGAALDDTYVLKVRL
jgi:hypothetical protein